MSCVMREFGVAPSRNAAIDPIAGRKESEQHENNACANCASRENSLTVACVREREDASAQILDSHSNGDEAASDERATREEAHCWFLRRWVMCSHWI